MVTGIQREIICPRRLFAASGQEGLIYTAGLHRVYFVVSNGPITLRILDAAILAATSVKQDTSSDEKDRRLKDPLR